MAAPAKCAQHVAISTQIDVVLLIERLATARGVTATEVDVLFEVLERTLEPDRHEPVSDAEVATILGITPSAVHQTRARLAKKARRMIACGIGVGS